MSMAAEASELHEAYWLPCYAANGGHGLDPTFHGLDIDPAGLAVAGQVVIGRRDPDDNVAFLTVDMSETAAVAVTVLLGHEALTHLWQATGHLHRTTHADSAAIAVYDEDGWDDAATVHIGRRDDGEPAYLRIDMAEAAGVDLTVWLDPTGLATLNTSTGHILQGL